MAGRSRALVLGCLALLVAGSLPVSGALVAGAPTADDRVTRGDGPQLTHLGGDSGGLAVQANNTTRQHDNPANISEAGDLLGVRDWLSNRMLQGLSTGAIQLDQGQYEQAQSVLGDEFGARLDQYVDVVGETDTETDDDNADPFERTRDAQRNLTETVQSYDETYEAYQDAVEADDEAAARERARRLQRLATDVRRLNRTVIGGYQRLENQSGADLGRATTSVENVTENVTERQREVDEALFTGTALALSSDSATISYSDPLRASGQLTTDAGEPVADREIRVRIAGRDRTVRTDGDGQFQLTFRPRTVRIDRSSLTVRYVPANESPYLASNDSVAVDIEQVTATLSVEEASEQAAFGDQVEATARLALDGQPVRGIPLRATIGSARLGSSVTAETGTASTSGTLPATVPAGNRSLTVSAGGPNMAVTADPVSRPISVRSTGTNLTVAAEQSPGDTLAVEGTLTTTDSRPVGEQPVEVAVGEAVTETVRTGADGSYALAVDGSQLGVTGNATVTVRARFDGADTNLDNASAATRFTYRNRTALGTGTGDGSSPLPSNVFPGEGPISSVALGGLAALLVLFVVLLVLRRRYADGGGSSTDAASGDDPDDATGVGPTAAADASAAEPADEISAADGLDFGPAESFLAAGNTAAAVRYAYQHFRGHVAEDVGAPESDTHWEFFERCRANGMDSDQLNVIRDLVEAYEAVEFRPGPADPDADALLAAIDAKWA
ncbi:hypothetical protein [Halosimplex pelagicum]|uniref:DUF4129 domain-containing protein n=1 Tax=Halosimplex pelagicum TaxID=869886 RepID=A0A7D5T2Q0_9EURY|nr:hypothetical protein [Halosimplex pelagicum]QLH81351.1 hypothetical protein HZS54_06805 [Halosimplex pelagicum]